MNIVSFNESFNDFSDCMCIVVFTQTCTLDCINCHNKYRLLKESPIDMKTLFNYLENAKPLVKAITISGGEPTDEVDLIEFIKQLHSLEYAIRVDTNGTNVKVLADVLPYLTEVAMDIKEDPHDFYKYKRVCRQLTEEEFNNVQQSLQLLSGFVNDDHHVILRTTLLDNLIDTEVIKNSLASYKYTQYVVQPNLSIIR